MITVTDKKTSFLQSTYIPPFPASKLPCITNQVNSCTQESPVIILWKAIPPL